MATYKPIKVIDPLTKKERIITPEEQDDLLEKGIFFDQELDKSKKENKNKNNEGD